MHCWMKCKFRWTKNRKTNIHKTLNSWYQRAPWGSLNQIPYLFPHNVASVQWEMCRNLDVCDDTWFECRKRVHFKCMSDYQYLTWATAFVVHFLENFMYFWFMYLNLCCTRLLVVIFTIQVSIYYIHISFLNVLHCIEDPNMWKYFLEQILEIVKKIVLFDFNWVTAKLVLHITSINSIWGPFVR